MSRRHRQVDQEPEEASSGWMWDRYRGEYCCRRFMLSDLSLQQVVQLSQVWETIAVYYLYLLHIIHFIYL